MRKTFAPLDDVLIERFFQPAADLIAHQLAVPRTTAACFCIDLASLSWIVSHVRTLSDAVSAWDGGWSALHLLVLLLGLVALLSLRTLFRRAGRKTANPLRLAMQPHRAIVVLMLGARLLQFDPGSLADAADLAMLLFAGCAMYLGACAERPPVRRVSGQPVLAGNAAT